jgi:hypothetical protein
MTAESRPDRTAKHQAPSWLVVTNALLASCSIGAAAIWLWVADAQSVAVIVAIMLVLTALAFMLARHALKRNWASQWFLQIPGPTMVIFLLFGTSMAVMSSLLAVALVMVLRRRSGSPGKAA